MPPVPDWTGFWAGIVRGIEEQRRDKPEPAWRRWLHHEGLSAEVWRRPRVTFGGGLVAATLAALTIWQAFYTPPATAAAVVVSSARTDHPGASVMVYSPPEKDLAVVWVFDAD